MQTRDTYYRQTYEAVAGEISNRRWRGLHQELKASGLLITVQTLRMYAQFKMLHPRTPITKQAIATYESFQNTYADYSDFTGIQLLEILRTIKPHVTDRMLINAWYKAGLQFSRTANYDFNQASKIVFYTAITRPSSRIYK